MGAKRKNNEGDDPAAEGSSAKVRYLPHSLAV